MAIYNNPRGAVDGTPDADIFIFDIRLDSITSVDGKEGTDTLVVDRSSETRSHFAAGDYANSGKFQGGVYYGRMQDAFVGSPAGAPLSFSQIEDIRFIGSAFDDHFDLAIGDAASNLQVDFDGGEGHDYLSLDFSALTTSISFVVDDETIASSFGTFANIEQFGILAGSGDDVIRTGAGNDRISTGAGSDEVFAGSGNDSIITLTGGDTVDGGVGNDHWSGDYAASTGALTVDLGSTITVSNGSTVINVEGVTLVTGSGDDRFNVSRLGTTVIEGGAGYDTLSHAIIDNVHRTYSVTGVPGSPSSLSGQVSTFTNITDSTRFTGIERVVLTGGTKDDLFFLDGVFAASAIEFDGGGGYNYLRANLAALAGASTFILQPDGSIVSNRGTFANFFQAWLTGGVGNDVFTTRDGDDRLTGGGGDDILDSGAAEDLLDGGSGSDSLYGGADDDALNGGTGNDLLDGGSGDDVMTGGTGSDVYVVSGGGDVVNENPGEGTDEVRTGLASYSLAALPNVENLTAISDSAHDFRGNGGNNVLTGGGGNDFFRLQDGGDDNAIGGGGNDVFLFGAAMTGLDRVDGGAGNDQIALQGDYAGANALTLGLQVVGVENLALLPGSDTRFGDAGTNFYDYNITTRDINVAAGVEMVVDANRLRLGEDFTFNGASETDGSFFIYGGGGTDLLTGGAKNDVFLFGAGGQWGATDVIVGGAGIDQLGLRGNYALTFGAGQLVGIENIGLLSAHDTRFGTLGSSYSYDLTMVDANVASGVQMTVDGARLRIAETFSFNGAAETDGSFRVFGGLVDDIVVGSQNADLLQGNGGADTLTGGAGADIFRYLATGDSTASAMDRILDFASGTDKIDLSRIDADTLTAGDQAFSWIGSNAFGGTAGQLRAYQDGANWFVQGDTNGDGNADLVIQLTVTGGALTQSDFLP